MGLGKLLGSYMVGSSMNASKRLYNSTMEKNVRHGELGKHWKFYTGLVLLGIGLHMTCADESKSQELRRPYAAPITVEYRAFGDGEPSGLELLAERP